MVLMVDSQRSVIPSEEKKLGTILVDATLCVEPTRATIVILKVI